MQKLYTVRKKQQQQQQQQQPRLGAGCALDHELLIAKFRLKLKKVEKTTRSFRYDLKQIPYDYTVKVRNQLFIPIPQGYAKECACY